jgi:chromosome partitioning protein
MGDLMNVICVTNQKGGCGKTTSAINLAAAMASLGKRSLIIDLDPQAHATFGLGVRADVYEGSMYNVLTEQAEKKHKFLEDIIVPIGPNLDLAPSHILLSTIEQEFTNKDESVSKLFNVLSSLSFPYEVVVIDCPPSLGFLTFNALRASETVIVPVELSSFSLMGVDKLLSMIELIRVKMQHTPRVFALSTLVDTRTNFSKYMAQEIKQAFGDHILNNFIHQSIAVKESQAKGIPTVWHSPKSRASSDYMLLAQEVLTKCQATESHLYRRMDGSSESEGPLRDFSLKMPSAKEVHLVGDFNNWSISNESLLWQKEEGTWEKRVFLGPGRHRYKFVVDGRWITDPTNDLVEQNPYGGADSVCDI